jgi:ABC-type sugar transport system ATPase subunit
LNSIPELSVARNIFLGSEPAGRFGLVSRDRLRAETQALLERYHLGLDADAAVGGLSVAQRQLVDIARALSSTARILILDEPTAVLSPAERDNLFTIIAGLRKSGLLVFYVSHRLEEIFDISDRISVLRDGRLVDSIVASRLTQHELVQVMTGREIRNATAPRAVPTGGSPMLRLTQERNGVVSEFTVRRGEILGLAGLVGSGRTRLAHQLVGFGRASEAKVELEGKPIRIRSPRQALQHGILYLTEDRKGNGVFPPLPIVANTTAAAIDKFSPWGVISHRAERRAAAGVLERLRLVARTLAAPVSELSGGNQQKVLLARALLCAPKVLICDEPTRGIDVAAKAEIYAILKGLATDGIGIILISSEFEELLLLSHRIAVVRDGAVVATFDTDDMDEHRLLLAATGTGAESIRSQAASASSPSRVSMSRA